MLDFYRVVSLKSDVVISKYHRQLSHFEESKLADRGEIWWAKEPWDREEPRFFAQQWLTAGRKYLFVRH